MGHLKVAHTTCSQKYAATRAFKSMRVKCPKEYTAEVSLRVSYTVGRPCKSMACRSYKNMRESCLQEHRCPKQNITCTSKTYQSFNFWGREGGPILYSFCTRVKQTNVVRQTTKQHSGMSVTLVFKRLRDSV